jgi:hypothetical protein
MGAAIGAGIDPSTEAGRGSTERHGRRERHPSWGDAVSIALADGREIEGMFSRASDAGLAIEILDTLREISAADVRRIVRNSPARAIAGRRTAVPIHVVMINALRRASAPGVPPW